MESRLVKGELVFLRSGKGKGTYSYRVSISSVAAAGMLRRMRISSPLRIYEASTWKRSWGLLGMSATLRWRAEFWAASKTTWSWFLDRRETARSCWRVSKRMEMQRFMAVTVSCKIA